MHVGFGVQKARSEKMTIESEIKTALESGSIIMGARVVAKALKMKNVDSVVLANNCPESVKKDISHYAKISNTKVQEFGGSEKQLGVLCGKPFAIAVLAIAKKK